MITSHTELGAADRKRTKEVVARYPFAKASPFAKATGDRSGHKFIGPSLSKAIELKAISKRYPFLSPSPLWGEGRPAPNPSETGGSGGEGERVRMRGTLKDFWALRDVSLDVYKGSVVGIIGRNGAGKTTLLNIITGVLSSTNGARLVNGKVLGLFNLGVGFQDKLSGKENVFLNGAIIGATKRELNDKLSSIIEFSELGDFIDMPLGTYSQGMRLRLAFSIIANLDFDILVIDEVLAVGDALFQNKCFARLMDFKRSGKTLIITSQGMDLIERLCDEVVLLDHGRLLFHGKPIEGIDRYRALLNTEKFFVGPFKSQSVVAQFIGSVKKDVIENTKRWAEDTSNWGNRLGAKEIVIESVELLNRFGRRCKEVRSGAPLRIRANFIARNAVKEPHFGIAIFRNDGVYCYGPNTVFDGYKIAEIKKGKGFFLLDYHRLLLAPGEYRLSVAIWDKNETLAYDYHDGCYKLIVNGYRNDEGQLLNIPFRLSVSSHPLPTGEREGVRGQGKSEGLKPIRLLNPQGEETDILMTNEPAKIILSPPLNPLNKRCCLWLGIYRDDDIYCQGIIGEKGTGYFLNANRVLSKSSLSPFPQKCLTPVYTIFFPNFSLLPGGYKVSIGVWDDSSRKVTMRRHGICQFRMIFNRKDHGTVYLGHRWRWSLP